MSDLNGMHLDDEVNFARAGAAQIIRREDFDDRIDIIPVSDPNIFSSTQRIAQAQAVLQMAQSAPQLHDMYEAYKRMYDAIRIHDIDQILIEPAEAARLDPVDENMAILLGKPIKAFVDQDHDSHIAVHLQFIQDPTLGGNPGAAQLQPVLIAHIAEHIAFLYRLRMQKAIGIQMPELPDIRDPKFKFQDVPPELDNAIAERAAQIVQESPQMAPIKGITDMAQQQQGQQNPLDYARQLAELEAQALKVRTEAEIQAEQAKAQSDMAIDQAKAQQNLQAQMMKMQADIDGKIAKLQAELQIAKQKAQADIQREETKVSAEIQRENIKAAQEDIL